MKTKTLGELFKLDNKVIVVTGAAGLLGRRHTEAIAAYGGTPVLLDINRLQVEDLAADLSKRFEVSALGIEVDITDEDWVRDSTSVVLEKFNQIDGLVNNAANNPKMESSADLNFSRLENFKLEVWEQDIRVGLTGAFLCSKYFGGIISRNVNGGSIVNISSDLGLIAPDQRLYRAPGLTEDLQPVKPVTYSVVKTGIIGLTRYLATYWADKTVRCNAICPGGVENGQSQEFLDAVSLRIPMARLAKADEYQGTLVWMLSEASSYLTGAVIAVDGGRTSW